MMRKASNDYLPALRFSVLALFYDPLVALTTRERTFKHELMRQADAGPGHAVLDVGCGTGILAIWMKQARPEISMTGIDADPVMLVRAKGKAERAGVDIAFEQGFSSHLPYADRAFDRIVSSLFFHHLTPLGYGKNHCRNVPSVETGRTAVCRGLGKTRQCPDALAVLAGSAL